MRNTVHSSCLHIAAASTHYRSLRDVAAAVWDTLSKVQLSTDQEASHALVAGWVMASTSFIRTPIVRPRID